MGRRYLAAKDVALCAGKKAREFFRDFKNLKVDQKSLQDPVSEADRAVETLILEKLKKMFPEDSFLGEEFGGDPEESVWIIDPIDGTANFVKGIPYFCVSICFLQDNEAKIGIIYDPMADELFTAVKGKGAFVNDRQIQASRCSDFSLSLFGLGSSRRTSSEKYYKTVSALMDTTCEYRKLGAGALMLAHTAAGRLEGYFEAHLNSWDAMAGLLICREAGAFTNRFYTRDALTRGNITLACARPLKDKVLKLLKVVYNELA